MSENLWTIVLAAGAGRRLASVTGGVPKQFWHYDGKRSLLEATLDRVGPLSPPDQTIIVVDRSHQPFMRKLSGTPDDCRVIYQPADRGTAVGVMLGLSEVLESAPEAIVLLTPSDHAIAQSKIFRFGIHEAIGEVRSGKSDIVLFGARPTTADSEYGWITSSRAGQHGRFRRVTHFSEKPSPDRALELLKSGAVWNTMVLVATASALFELYWTSLPSLASTFARALRLSRPAREAFLDEVYPTLPREDFSHHVIAPAQGLSLYVWPASMGWSDLGTPARFKHWMQAEVGAVQRPVDPRRPHAATAAHLSSQVA